MDARGKAVRATFSRTSMTNAASEGSEWQSEPIWRSPTSKVMSTL
jgi:anti-sigma-K factor RskA